MCFFRQLDHGSDRAVTVKVIVAVCENEDGIGIGWDRNWMSILVCWRGLKGDGDGVGVGDGGGE